MLCDVNEQVLEEKVAEINAKGQGRAIGLVCDVRDYSYKINTGRLFALKIVVFITQ